MADPKYQNYSTFGTKDCSKCDSFWDVDELSVYIDIKSKEKGNGKK